MSFYYYRPPKEEEKVEGWGFRKVNSAELTGIMDRITRPTYNSRMHNMECTQVHNYVYTNTNFLARRSPTACDRRRSASALPHTAQERRLSERELQRVIRRLRKPTVSYEARMDYLAEEELQLQTGNTNSRSGAGGSRRPKSAPTEDRQKAFQQLSRPTTASRAKTLGDCTLCLDKEEMELKNSLVPFQYDYGDDTAVPAEELDYIVDRVSAPTFAHKRMRCPRTPKPVNEVRMRSKTPLASGLARSKNVNEIVQRLHSAQKTSRPSPNAASSKHRYRAPAATEITIFS